MSHQENPCHLHHLASATHWTTRKKCHQPQSCMAPSLGLGLWPKPQNQAPGNLLSRNLQGQPRKAGSRSLSPTKFKSETEHPGGCEHPIRGIRGVGLKAKQHLSEWAPRLWLGDLALYHLGSQEPVPACTGQPSPPQCEWPQPLPAGLAMPLTSCPSALRP